MDLLREPTEDLAPEMPRETTATPETVSIPVGTTLEGAERALIARTLAAVGGNKKEAARLLGISRSALYAKLARFDDPT